MKRRYFIVLALILSACGTNITITIPTQPAAQPPAQPTTIRPTVPVNTVVMPANLTSAPIVKVVDGDTIDVSLNGQTSRVRLIGLNTPETVDPRRSVQCFGTEASNRLKQLLQGQRVFLEDDPTQGTRDRFGRLLYFVWLPDGRLVNLVMIAEGYANEYTYDLPYKYQSQFKSAARQAEQNLVGLWAPETCAGDFNNPTRMP